MTYDYIVVGAGTAGCVIASRLTEDDSVRVLLVEAGAAERTHAMTVPSAWPENLGSAADWGEVTAAHDGIEPAGYPRGKALGGSSAINAMVHVRGHRAIYDGWASAGASGWGFGDLLPYFKRSERAVAQGRDPALRGTEGPVIVAPATDRHPVASAFAEGLAGIGCARSADLSGSQQEGVAWVDLAISGGERVSAADAYLRPVLARPNLTVHADCLAVSLQVSNGRCTGLRYLRDGAPALAQASAEVIVCAGAIGSPQLLIRSGIGPADQVRALGLDVVADIAQVGENLQDHPVILVSYAAGRLPASQYNNGEACAALRSELAGACPDLHLFPILLPLAPLGLEPPPSGFALVSSVVAPDSRGSVRLASAAPDAMPLIDPRFLTQGRDLDRIEAGLALVRQAAAGSALAGLGSAEVWPGPDVRSRPDLRAYIRHRVGSYFHPAGTCAMGSDDGAVVDPQLRVRGVSGLRVADASVLPVIPNAHPNATVLAVAERAADLIRDRAAAS